MTNDRESHVAGTLPKAGDPAVFDPVPDASMTEGTEVHERPARDGAGAASPVLTVRDGLCSVEVVAGCRVRHIREGLSGTVAGIGGSTGETSTITYVVSWDNGSVEERVRPDEIAPLLAHDRA